MWNLSTESCIVHDEDFQLLDVEHTQGLESVGKHVPCAFVVTVTDVDHRDSALEVAAYPGVDTSWPPP